MQRKISSQNKLAQLQILIKLSTNVLYNTAKDTFLLKILLYIVIFLLLCFYQLSNNDNFTCSSYTRGLYKISVVYRDPGCCLVHIA